MTDSGEYQPYQESAYCRQWRDVIQRIQTYIDNARPTENRSRWLGDRFEEVSYPADDGTISTSRKIRFSKPDYQVELVAYQIEDRTDPDDDKILPGDTYEIEIKLFGGRIDRPADLIIQMDDCQATISNPDNPGKRESLIGRRTIFDFEHLHPFQKYIPAELDSAEAEVLFLIDVFMPVVEI